MIIDFSSTPPLPELRGVTPHLQNYRRVYRASEEQTDQAVGPEALASYLRLYDALDARTVVVKARDAESTFGFKIENRDLARFCQTHGPRFIGFAGVDPHKGKPAVAELEIAVKELVLSGLNLQCFEHKLHPNDRLLYPLYAKCVELDVPVRIYSTMNYANDRPYDLGHPRHLDQVAMDFPELRIVAGLSGWPWVNDLVGLLRRHPNLYCDTASHHPRYFGVPGSGWEMFLQFGNTLLQDKIMIGFSKDSFGLTVPQLAALYEELPLKETVIEKWLYGNAKRFLRR